MIYMINSFELEETNVPSSLKTNCKTKSIESEKRILLIQIASDKLKPVVAVCMEKHTILYIDHKGKVINAI